MQQDKKKKNEHIKEIVGRQSKSSGLVKSLGESSTRLD